MPTIRGRGAKRVGQPEGVLCRDDRQTPAGNGLDIETVAAIAHEHELTLMWDSHVRDAYLCRRSNGARHRDPPRRPSIGGHGTSIGGR